MASKAKHHREFNGGESGEVTQLCSINGSGLVFVSRRKFPVSSELSLTVQTGDIGVEREWNVSGLVVECRNVKRGRNARYQVTLLFSELPDELKSMVAGKLIATGSFIPLENCPIFGLN